MGNATPLSEETIRRATRRKVLRRIIGFMIVCYFVNYLDRSAISFAAPNGMDEALGLNATTFGFASGVFFIGYIIVEIPSNLAMHKFGARKWMARILVTWGIVAVIQAFVVNAPMLYLLRFLLGVAEAGFSPGIVLFLSYWFLQRDRTMANSLFLIGIPLSSVIGGPLMSWLITVGHGALFGMEGWRFMFIVVGLPAVILGVICYFYLTDKPSDAKWLTSPERDLLRADLEKESAGHSAYGIKNALFSGRVWILCLEYFGVVYGLYAIAFFLPTIVDGFQKLYHVKYTPLDVGYITAIPWAFATIFMILMGIHSRRTNEVGWHVAISAWMGAVGIFIAILGGSPFVVIVGVSIACMGICAAIPLSFGLVTAFVGGVGAAAALALVNSVGNLGGFAGPFIYGWFSTLTHSGTVGLYVILALCILSGILGIIAKQWAKPDIIGGMTPRNPVDAKK